MNIIWYDSTASRVPAVRKISIYVSIIRTNMVEKQKNICGMRNLYAFLEIPMRRRTYVPSKTIRAKNEPKNKLNHLLLHSKFYKVCKKFSTLFPKQTFFRSISV